MKKEKIFIILLMSLNLLLFNTVAKSNQKINLNSSNETTQTAVENILARKLFIGLSGAYINTFLQSEIDEAIKIVIDATALDTVNVANIKKIMTTEEIVKFRFKMFDINNDASLSNLAKKVRAKELFSKYGKAGLDVISISSKIWKVKEHASELVNDNWTINEDIALSIGYESGTALITSIGLVKNVFPNSTFTSYISSNSFLSALGSRVVSISTSILGLVQLQSDIYLAIRDANISTFISNWGNSLSSALSLKITLIERMFNKQIEKAENGEVINDNDIETILNSYLYTYVKCYSERQQNIDNLCNVELVDMYNDYLNNYYYLNSQFGVINSYDLEPVQRIKIAIYVFSQTHSTEMLDTFNFIKERLNENRTLYDVIIAGAWPFNTSNEIFNIEEFISKVDPCDGVMGCVTNTFYQNLFNSIYEQHRVLYEHNAFEEAGNMYINTWETATSPNTYSLSVNKSGNGSVSSNTGNIQCGIDCVEIYNSEDTITLSASSGNDAYFKNWTGYCQGNASTCNVSLYESVVVGAHFSHCIELDYSWIKTGVIYAGETNNFDAQYKLVNRCNSVQSLSNSEISFHNIDGSYAQTCFDSGPVTVPAYGTYLSGKQYCTVNSPGDYKVIQKNQLLSNQWIDSNIQFTTILPKNMPSTPSKPNASDGMYTDKVRITWQSINGIDSYKLFKCTNGLKVSCSILTTTNSTTYDDFSGEDRVDYFYRIKAYDSVGGDSEYSSVDKGYKLGSTELPVVTGVPSATDGKYADKVIISWTAEVGVIGYGIYRCSTQFESSCHNIGSTENTLFEDTEGLVGTIYIYRYKTINHNGASLNYSDSDAGNRSGSSSIPVKPAAPIATDGDFETKVNVSWLLSSDSDSYKLLRCDNSNESSCNEIHTTVSNSYDDTSGSAGTSFYYRIQANNSNGFSMLSDADIGFRNNISSTPGIPAKPSASDGTYTDKIRITWTPVGGAIDYTVYRCSNVINGCISISTTASTTFDDAAILPGTTYFYRIQSNASESSDLSEYDAGFISGNTPIPAPGTPSATDGTYLDKVVISWQALPQADIIYRVYRCTTTSTTSCHRVCSVEGTTCNDRDSDGIRHNKTYYYRLKTITPTLIESAFTNYDVGSLGNIASVPEKPTASYGTYGDRINITWAQVSGAVNYQLYVCYEVGSPNDVLTRCYFRTTTNSTSYDDTNQDTEDGRHLFYHLRVDTGLGWSDFTSCCGPNVGFRSVSRPDPPNAYFNASDNNKDHVEVGMTPSDGAIKYKIYRCWTENLDTCNFIGMADVNAVYKDYDAGMGVYYYRAKAVGHSNLNGDSDFSIFDKGSRRTSEIRKILEPTIDTRFDSMELLANDNGSGFGESVSNFGDFTLIGLRSFEKVLGGSNRLNVGIAYLYRRDNNREWVLEEELSASDESVGNRFGQEVVLNESYAIIKAGSGKIYIFEKQVDDSWIEVQIISPNLGDTASKFLRMNLLDNRLILGAYNELNEGVATGSVYIFEKGVTNQWIQIHKLISSDLDEGDRFGVSLGQSEDTIVIGSYRDDDNGEDAGAVYIFEKQADSSWQETFKLKSETVYQSFYHFGIRLAMKGDILAITSRYFNDANNNYPASFLNIYEKTANGKWLFTGDLHANDEVDSNLFGYGSYSNNIAINSIGDEIYIGAPGDKDSGGIYNDGAVYQFKKQPNGQWIQSNKFKANDEGEFDKRNFGASISLSGNKLLIGANSQFRGNSYYFGTAYTYYIPKEAGINIINKNGLTTSESGATQELRVVLNSEPQVDVLIDFISNNINEGIISPSSLTFTKENWYIEQSIVITGINDHINDGNTVYQVISSDSVSFDDLYNGLQTAVVNITNIEDGKPLELSVIGQGNVTSIPNGVNCDSSCTVIIASSPTLVLTATPSQGYAFEGWSGSNCSGTNTCNVDMSQTQNVIAQFVPINHDLNVSLTGNGSVKSIFEGIDCGNDCSESYVEGEEVTLFSQPDNGQLLSSWGVTSCNNDSSCTLVIDQEKNINVSFNPKVHVVTAISNEASGVSPSTIQNITNGETATFTINDIDDFNFDSVTGSCGGTLSGVTYTTFPINSDCNVLVNFISALVDVSISKTNNVNYLTDNQVVSYLITVTNTSNANISTANVQDILPSTLINSTWECNAYLGATCTAAGNGNIIDSASLPVGSYVEYLLTATVNANADELVINSATVFVNGELAENLNDNTSVDHDQVISIIFANGFEGSVVLKMIDEEYKLKISESVINNLYDVPGQYSLEKHPDFEAGVQLRYNNGVHEYRYYYVTIETKEIPAKVILSEWIVVDLNELILTK